MKHLRRLIWHIASRLLILTSVLGMILLRHEHDEYVRRP